MADSNVTIQDLRQLLAEVIASQKDSFAEVTKMQKDNAIQFKEVKERFKDTDARFKSLEQRFKETNAQFKETGKRIQQAFDLFEGQWGKLMESLVEGDLIRLLQARGIEVRDTSTRRKGNYKGTSYEFDIIAHNGNEIVIVEVKTTLRVSHVKKFIERLKEVKTWLPEYKNYKIYGTVAFLRAEEESDTFAQTKKLYVIRATGDSASIVNAMDFEPRVF